MSSREEDESVKAERQARLSEAMGRLFLKDRVAKMEDEAHTLEYKRVRPTKGSSPNLGSTRGVVPREQARSESPVAVRIIDVSLLIYSLRTLHEWIKDGHYRLVIPLEALNTLDVLKKGDTPINIAARKATRFLDERISASTGGMKPLLVLQNETERMRWGDMVQTPSTVAQGDARELGASLADEFLAGVNAGKSPGNQRTSSDSRRSGDSGRSRDSTLPLHIRETLGCMALHEQKLGIKDRTLQSQPKGSDDVVLLALAVAFPPPSDDGKNNTRFNARADGRILKSHADELQMSVVVAPTASSWLQLGEGADPKTKTKSSQKAAGDAPRIIFR